MNKQKENAPQNRGAVEGKKRFSTKEKLKAHKKALRKQWKKCRRRERWEKIYAFINAIIPNWKK